MTWDRATAQALPSSEVTHLHLLRHGKVDTGGERRCYGHTDYALSTVGRAQTDALVDWVAGWMPPVDLVLTSDLSRCTALAEPVASRLGVPFEVVPALREQDMGAWEGRTWADLTQEDIETVRAYWTDYAGTSPPGGESFRAFGERVDGWFADAWPRLRGKRVVVACHAGVARALCCRLLGLPWSEALRFAPVPGSHTWLQVAQAGTVLQALGERPFAQDPGVVAFARARAAAARDRPPRIALSGSAGTGKTTLGRALAAALDVPYVPEGMRARLEGGLDLHALGPEGLRALVRELWAEQQAREAAAVASHGGFVADRSPVDYAAFWLTYRFSDDPAATRAFFAETLGAVERYDRIVCLPWGVLPLQADGVRTPNPWVQRAFQATVEGLLTREVPEARLALLPTAVGSVSARVAWVQDLLAETGTALGGWGSAPAEQAVEPREDPPGR